MLDFIEEKRGKKAREEVKVLEEKDNERRQALVKLKPTPLFFPYYIQHGSVDNVPRQP